ncbi:hypothetical protein HOU91_gp25 [Enterobacter phage EcpYZU01]|uniref:hypothetical protein n=1 Tax=Enterobacter phage EcpYZU01 TaxID=2483604 RepID=UPI0018ACA7DA|nr:hypothetical protein HOU91_gp25 [Enterobacter phage EcpYZU01]
MFFNNKAARRLVELASKVDTQEELLMRANAEVERLRRKLKQSDAMRLQACEPVTVKRMVGLKFRALFNGLYQPTEFKTGSGPCGKTVTHFTTSRTERTLTIHQHHTDGSQKDFEYRLSDIDGRIQYDYEQVKVYGEEAERERALQAFMRVSPRVCTKPSL